MIDDQKVEWQALHAPVINNTGLEGRYDATIDIGKYIADAAPKDRPFDPVPLIVTALQEELGLKLELGKHFEKLRRRDPFEVQRPVIFVRRRTHVQFPLLFRFVKLDSPLGNHQHIGCSSFVSRWVASRKRSVSSPCSMSRTSCGGLPAGIVAVRS